MRQYRRVLSVSVYSTIDIGDNSQFPYFLMTRSHYLICTKKRFSTYKTVVIRVYYKIIGLCNYGIVLHHPRDISNLNLPKILNQLNERSYTRTKVYNGFTYPPSNVLK